MRQQIEADKRARAEKAAKKDAQPQGAVAPAAPKPAVPAPKSDANETRIRVRAPDGMWTGTISATSTLRDLNDLLVKEGKASGPMVVRCSLCPATDRSFR